MVSEGTAKLLRCRTGLNFRWRVRRGGPTRNVEEPIIYVAFETLERYPKLSADWFRQTAKQNAVA